MAEKESEFSKKDETPGKLAVNDLALHYWQTITYLINLIKAAELKAGLILSFYGILLNFVYQNAESTVEVLEGNIVFYVLISVWFVLTLVSVYYSIRSFIPRIEASYDKNAFFFGDIISKFGTIQEFSDTFYDISNDQSERFHQLGQQIFINAKISAIKLKNVNKSLRFLAYSLFMLLMIVFIYLGSVIIG